MESQTKQCQNCKNEFKIDASDFVFYQNIKVPAPTWCPECRLIRRLMWREYRMLYNDKCDSCGKFMLSTYPPDSIYTVYCSPCWWADAWSSMDYGREYDFSTNFFEQFNKLLVVVPRLATTVVKSINCDYSNSTDNSKNCYLCFGGYYSEDCNYCYGPIFSRNCVDSDVGFNMDHAYMCHRSDAVHNCKFTFYSEEIMGSAFLYDCKGCTNCFASVNLRNKKYYIFNKPYSKQEYAEEMKKWDLGSYTVLEKAKKTFREHALSIPRRFAFITNSTNVTGDYIKNSKNCKVAFSMLQNVEDCKYVNVCGLNLKNCMDVGMGGEKSELCYESTGFLGCQKLFFTKRGTDVINGEYTENCRGSQNIFGCVSVRNKKYCILNRQYSKEEYEILVPKIKQHMNEMPYIDSRENVYKYGEYFPGELSPWKYNESGAQEWFPLSKEQVLEKGLSWQDEPDRNYTITKKFEDLPDHINDVSDTITKEVIQCLHNGKCKDECTTAFRILPDELGIYRQMNIALPRLCPNCRWHERIQWRNAITLYKRLCMCSGSQSDVSLGGETAKYTNQSKHLHGEKSCKNEFETVYSPERIEIVYCQQCYNDEFV